MTTFKYSVPWFESESSLASALGYSEWTEACKKLGSVLPAVELEATDYTDELTMRGGSIENGVQAEWRKVYRGFRDLRGVYTGVRKKATRGFAARLMMTKKPLASLKAVHAAFLHLKEWAEKRPTSYARGVVEWTTKVAASALYAQAYNCKMHPPNIQAKSTALVQAAERSLTAPLQVLEGVRRLKSGRHASIFKKLTRSLAAEEMPGVKESIARKNRTRGRNIFPKSFPPVEVWGGRVFMETAYGTAILSTGDMQRLEQYAANWMNSVAVLEIDHAIRPATSGMKTSAEWMSEEMVRMSEGCMEVPAGKEVSVCRAYMQAYNAALATKAGLAAAGKEAVAELEAMPYAEESGAMVHFRRLAALRVGDIVNVGKIHKTLPAGSDLGAATLAARAQKASSENPSRPVEANRPPLDPDLFRKCLRDEVTRSLRLKDMSLATKLKDPTNVPKWFPAWRDRRVVPPIPGWSDALDLRGSATPPARSDYAPGTFKDSTLAPEDIPTEAKDVPPVEETSMVMRRFLSMDYPSQADAQAALMSEAPRVARSDQKPENYKDPLRLFYIAQLKDRLGVSWTEACVYSVARFHPCYMLGKSPREQQTRARSMISPAVGGEAKRFFSFDLSNWSAGMAAKVQRESGELWAEVFDNAAVGRAYATMVNATVYVQKHGVLAGFESKTANFEGYDGKAMTMLHLALMSAVVARTRQVTRNPEFAVELMTYIDDGAAAVVAPRGRINSVFGEFMKAAEEVYGAERFVLHATKCLPSDRMFTFLNEVYYAGAHEVSATKAALRIASEPKEEHESLADRVMVLTAGTQGAIAAGLNSVVGAVYCYFMVALELLSWIRDTSWILSASPVSIALFLLSPTAYYGLAVPSPVGFDKTGKGSSLAEGISAMQSAARAYPDLAPVVVARLRKPLPARSYEAILRNPLGHGGHSVIRTNRVALAVREALKGETLNPVAEQVMRPAFTFPVEDYGRALLGGTKTISAATVALAWKATPVPLAEAWVAKFESSRTIARLIGRPALRRIGLLHRLDATRAIEIAIGRET